MKIPFTNIHVLRDEPDSAIVRIGLVDGMTPIVYPRGDASKDEVVFIKRWCNAAWSWSWRTPKTNTSLDDGAYSARIGGVGD